MTKKSLEQVIKQNKQFGFDPAIIQIAYANVKGDSQKIIDQIFRLQSQSSHYPVKPSNPQDQDAQLSKAIQMSINEAKDKKISLQPLNPQQRVRKSGTPVGLKNIGNTCYFNSLLQTYFQNANFVRQILRYQIPQKYQKLTKQQVEKKSQQDFQFKKKYASCKLVQSLKILFAQMIGSDRKYVDPTQVLTSLVDDYGNQLPVGDQKDIGEFNLIFLSRIDEGLSQLYQKQKMQIEGDNEAQDSPSKLKVVGNMDENLPEQASHSLLKHSSIKLTESSIVSKQFIGKVSNSFHNIHQNYHKQEQELFSLLFVNVRNKQLYQALQQVVISHIDDYRNEKGEVVGVQKRTWIQQAPKTLFFQIDRVIFDKEKGTLQKINDIFQFPKQFYIDPFLNKNKQKALQIQKKVKKLRGQKQKFIQFLDQLQNYGKNKQNISKTISLTYEFLQSQTNKMQLQVNQEKNSNYQGPLFFPQLQNRINSDLLDTLRKYSEEIQKKQANYKTRIESIQKQIQKCYESIRTQPYHLYSILIHEGSAQMGHYYSYIHDIQTNTWRKYNDINISQESPQQVLKQAKGINATSAYYLVYAQKDILIPFSSQPPIKNYKMSIDQTYMKDYYSSFLNKKLRQAIITENNTMYHQIQQFKMGSFATRVVDSYAKKFQICNQTFRKNKPQKKKNSPPLLINLPLYIKFNNQQQYKNSLIQNCIQQYGPKEYNPAFQDILNKKLNNFNEHKRPKNDKTNEANLALFMDDIYHAIAAKLIFQAIKDSSYERIFVLLKQLQIQNLGSYFNWLGNLLSKILIVHLLIQAQFDVINHPDFSIQKLKLMAVLLFKCINIEQQKILYNNCIFWMAQIGILFQDEGFKKECQHINEIIQQRKYENQYDELFMNKQNEKVLNEIKGSIEIGDAAWNLSRTEDVYINEMLSMRQKVKEKIEASNELYRQMKKYNLPLQRGVRDKIISKKK